MPKELIGMRARVARAESRMCATVMGSSRPERALKNEVFRLCDTMTSREVGAVLGRVYMRLGAREQTAFMAEYMKDLYGSDSRRLFVPKPIANAVGVKVKTVGRQQGEVKKLKLALTDGSVEEVPLVDVGTVLGSVAGKSGRRRSLDKAVASAKAIARENVKTARGTKAASADTGSTPPSGPAPDDVVTLQSVANYCMNTASRYSEAKPVYDMLMELYSKNPTQEWLEIKDEIKAHVNKLPGNSYFTFIGTNVERQIQNNVENQQVVERTVAQPRDRRRNPTRTGKIVSDVYEYVYYSHDEGGRRIAELHRKLMRAGWIDDETKVEKFEKLFSGVPDEFHIKWIGAHADLCALIKCLLRRGLIKCPGSATQWVIARSHFKNRAGAPFSNWNRQRENQKTQMVIEKLADILDPAKEI